MFTVEIIEESLEYMQILQLLQPYFIFQRIQHSPEEIPPVWHTNEYHIPPEDMPGILELLKTGIKAGWYVHGFNRDTLYVILRGKWFALPPHRNSSWDDMIAYGTQFAGVPRQYLENIPLHA